MRRESTDGLKLDGLWAAEGFITGPSVYRHIITGAKSPRAVDALGGVLADDMGLGKTLSMIATIVSTMTRSEKHALEKVIDDGQSKAPLIPSKATLVIVPSARKLCS